MRKRTAASVFVAILAILATLAPAAAPAAERTVSVTAGATIKVPDDSARLGFAVSTEKRSRGAALSQTSSRLRAVIAAVEASPGVGPGDVRTGRISVRKTSHGRKTVYRASEGIGVTLHEAGAAGSLTSAAIAAGATGVSGPTFFVGDTEAAFTKALTAAFDKAKARAAALAGEAGATLGAVLSLDEGNGAEFVPLEAAGKDAPSAGCGVSKAAPGAAPQAARACVTPPTKPGNSQVTATVHAVFELR